VTLSDYEKVLGKNADFTSLLKMWTYHDSRCGPVASWVARQSHCFLQLSPLRTDFQSKGEGPVAPRPDSVIGYFCRITPVPPTSQALMTLRQFFVCTGPVTRTQRRSKAEMAAAFESHSTEILAALQNPTVLAHVTRILLQGDKRVRDKQTMLMSPEVLFGTDSPQ
jgi:hypothetical protein